MNDNGPEIVSLPIGPQSYPVAQMNMEIVRQLMPIGKILAEGSGKPISGEIAFAYVTLIRALIVGDHAELTDDYVILWVSPALCTMVAIEWQRQYFAAVNLPRA